MVPPPVVEVVGGAVPSHSRSLLPALAELPGHLIWRAHARVSALLGEKLAVGTDIHTFAALQALDGGGPRSQQEVAESISVSRTTMVKVAADLLAQGLIERVRNPADRRSYALTRTQAGALTLERRRAGVLRLEAELLTPFDDDEQAELHGLLLATVRHELAQDTPEALLASCGFLVSKLHLKVRRDFLTAMEPLGLEPPDLGVLTALRSTGPTPQAELARALGVSGAHMVGILDDLEQRGLLERRRSTTDRRTHLLHLLPASDDVWTRAKVIEREVMGRWLTPLSEEQVERLRLLLVRFVTG